MQILLTLLWFNTYLESSVSRMRLMMDHRVPNGCIVYECVIICCVIYSVIGSALYVIRKNTRLVLSIKMK